MKNSQKIIRDRWETREACTGRKGDSQKTSPLEKRGMASLQQMAFSPAGHFQALKRLASVSAFTLPGACP